MGVSDIRWPTNLWENPSVSINWDPRGDLLTSSFAIRPARLKFMLPLNPIKEI
jgi:hypothetical protein